jgi:hypothetical protein
MYVIGCICTCASAGTHSSISHAMSPLTILPNPRCL